MKNKISENQPAKIPDPVEMTRAMIRIGEQSQKLMREFLEKQKEGAAGTTPDLSHISHAFLNMTHQLMQHPAKMMEAGFNLWQDYMRLWQNTAQRLAGEEKTVPIITPASNDKRFADAVWNENALFDYIKQSYLLSARWMQNVVKDAQGLDHATARKVDFYTRQFVDAMSPSNFALTNPEVLRRTMETGGENLVKGLENLLHDLERGKGMLKIAMTDEHAFDIGKDIANTPGKVIYQNDLMQLIQYEPLAKQVYTTPVLIIPPWINKFYILDLGEKKSYVRFLLEQGHQVFMISWVNPDASLADKNFEDYMVEGPIAALEQVHEATDANNVNIVGYCLGGTLLACLLAYLEANEKEKQRLPAIASGTFLVTMLDFRDAGELAVFIDDEQITALEERMKAQGFLDAATMATTFNLLRANDLIWSFVVNNYLLGKEPFPFDLLYWNADSTRMPAAMHSFYLRMMYQKNLLVKPGGLKMKGVPIDLSKIITPAFFLSTRDDHISPWRSTYAGARLLKGSVRFTLSASGHIAGVVNPPVARKYNYWVNDALPAVADKWLEGAQTHEGSWWPAWENWLATHAGEKAVAKTVEDGPTTIIENAPGSYVRVKAG